MQRIWTSALLAGALVAVSAAQVASQQGGQGAQGPPTADVLKCPEEKRGEALGGDQAAVLAELGDLTALRDRGDLQLLASRGFAFMPNQFTSIKGIGVTMANPVSILQPGSPNVLFYAPSADAGDATDPRGPDFPYELAGWGYVVPYAPFHFPGFLPCVGEGDWHVHERGVDASASGKTVPMAPAETGIGNAAGTLGEGPPMRAVVGYPHPRTWSVHFWRDPSGLPRSGIVDPTDPAPGVDAGVGSNFYFLDEPPTGVLEPGANGFPVSVQPGEGNRVDAGGGEYTFKSTAFSPGGSLSVVEAKLTAGSKRVDSGALGHDEGWYLMDGEITFDADGQSLPARKGSFVYLPAGSDYSFQVATTTARAVYVTVTPGQKRTVTPKPFVLEPGEGEEVTVGGSPYFLKARADDTAGAFSFMEINLKSGSEPPPHIHHKEVELFYLLDGEMTFVTGGQTIPAQSGGLVQLPIAMPHFYSVLGDGTAKALLISIPGGLEDLFRTLDSLNGAPPTAAQALKTGVEPAVPPPSP
jgi:quercetin dioxygenase-like cupin family protein